MSRAIKITDEQRKTMLEYYQAFLQYQENSHIIARARTDRAVITFYTTNTVLFQGLDELKEYAYWANQWGLTIDAQAVKTYENYDDLSAVGSDEVGTGDYFGPIVVCSTFVEKEKIKSLKQYGVKDSKLLTDDVIIDLALKIKDEIPYSLLVLSPDRINAQRGTQKDNFNYIKAYLHNSAITSILNKIENVKYDAIIVDEFVSKEMYLKYLNNVDDVETDITMVKNGERAHVSVAAASILARAAFIREMNKLSKKYDIELIKGASSMVDRQAIALVKQYGMSVLKKIAKYKFANTEKVKEYFSSNNIKPKP